MPENITVTNDAEHARALARLDGMMNNCINADEVEELRALAQAIQDYESENSWLANLETDAVHEIEFLLDEEDITLEQLLPVFGGMQPFIEFMTRRRNLDPKTLEALVSDLGIDREEIDKPFCKPEGWNHITLEKVDCCDEDPCPMGIGEWRERLLAHREQPLTRIDRIGQDNPAYPVYPC